MGKAQTANFVPKLSYSKISFSSVDNDLVSPWGQAFSLLADIATFPRKVLTDTYFFHGVKVSQEKLIEAMNVADDKICNDLQASNIKVRCKKELDRISQIKEAPIDSKTQCEDVLQILNGDLQ